MRKAPSAEVRTTPNPSEGLKLLPGRSKLPLLWVRTTPNPSEGLKPVSLRRSGAGWLVRTTPNPSEGLKLLSGCTDCQASIVRTTPNPSEGLKQLLSQWLRYPIPSPNHPQPVRGIETIQARAARKSWTPSPNHPQPVRGIETAKPFPQSIPATSESTPICPSNTISPKFGRLPPIG